MTAQSKTLYLLRHAKSAWDTDAADDFSRPLNPRGTRDALKMGRWMQHQQLLPEAIVSSPAWRAWQTVTTVCQALQIEPATINFDRRLYLASRAELCHVIAGTDRNENSLLLVGHNPGLEELVAYLLAGELPEAPGGKLLPTAALCILHLPDWRHLEKNSAQLVQLTRPKSL